MSHVATVKLDVQDLESLKNAVGDLGLEWREGQKTYKWFNSWVGDYHGEDAAYREYDPKEFGKNAEHAIRDKEGEYEIGVAKAKEGNGYSLLVDFWGNPGVVRKCGGKGLPDLKQRYAEHVTIKQLRKTGFRTTVQRVRTDGSVQVVGVR
jgi:hypothetical protein